ncbi:virulence factor [Paenisporosarcina sp. OV554]|uniref:virulence factor n=1 Tax=Paenisporosarcina sp. OV554 TaxID=2135694 RepID=UPI000D347283|nr:virulence factor [Paenisporosarcina sp. OV554]PUB13977.1 PBS lyase HEAT-like repeat-containing protein [Paenisporosarcina sp. OV554]
MKILTIEPTPSPNTMKVIVDHELPFGKSFNYKKEDNLEAPKEILSILNIQGVKGIYHVADFLAIERLAKNDWEQILSEVRNVLGENLVTVDGENQFNEHFGEVNVHVQQIKGIPLQVKVFDQTSEERIALSPRFVEAMNTSMKEQDENYILQRKWADFGVRYGEKKDIAEQIREEIEATYPDSRLQQLIEEAKSPKNESIARGRQVSLEDFQLDQWQERFQLLDQLADPSVDDYPLLDQALSDEQMSIRRLATVYLGMINDESVIPFMEKALLDKSPSVRRTAGDCMSDLGFSQFEDAMQTALGDKNKLVRWRAAMFLYESGTEKSLPALHQAKEDAEFEVKLQVNMAIARIEQGEEAKGSVWKQMTESRN